MHIALHHDAVIPPLKYGGTERIVFWLAQALLKLGHEVTLIARPGSYVEGARWLNIQDWEKNLPSNVDVVHFQATPASPFSKPFLVTIHGNGRPGERFFPNTVFLSAQHAKNHNASVFVYNGIDPEEYFCDSTRENNLVFLAKASWKVKNLAGAIELARAAHLPLTVMGSRDWPFSLQRKLPAFSGVRYLGMVNDHEKKQVLRSARALIFSVRWPEPFGVAITEALASGCAVFGTPYGSLPEIVTPEVGFLSDDASTLLRALHEKTFSPMDCRARVHHGLTSLDMARSYVELYKKVAAGRTLSDPENAPRALFQDSPQTLLPYRYLKT